MSLENAELIHQLDPANPSGADRLANGDDHIRMIKAALKATFPHIEGPVTLTHTFLNSLVSSALPVGIILMWSGATVPDGWHLCDGSTINRSDGGGPITLPDLRGRVAVGASGDHLLGTTFGQEQKTVTSEAGGAHTHSATTQDAGSHVHSATLSGQTGDAAPSQTLTTTTHLADGSGGTTLLASASLSGSLTHSHTVSLTGNTTEAGSHSHPVTVDQHMGHAHPVTVDVTQPSLAIHYIMKV